MRNVNCSATPVDSSHFEKVIDSDGESLDPFLKEQTNSPEIKVMCDQFESEFPDSELFNQPFVERAMQDYPRQADTSDHHDSCF